MSRAAGITSNTVPWEILRAAGYAPRLLEAGSGPAPFADRYMEEVFDPQYRIIFDRLCAGAWSDLNLVVAARTSEQEHKLYLYLREASRQKVSSKIPKLYLYNLLHTRMPEAYEYGLERTRRMVRDFAVEEARLKEAIAESNQARDLVREVQRKRYEGRIEGSAALELIREFYRDRSSFAHRAIPASRPLADGRPRILIKGAPLNSLALHRAIEAAGGYVVAEDDWRGSRAAGERNVRTDQDPVTAIFEKYFYDEVSPRIPAPGERDAWLRRQISEGRADGVVFYLPLEDDVEGWDYPRQAAWLHEQRVPYMVVRTMTGAEALASFLEQLTHKR